MTTIDPPSKATLNKYGLTAEEWLAILDSQGGCCAICEQVPSPNKQGKIRFVTDHVHTKGWAKMPPEQRKLWVRCITCWWCNHAYLGRGITVLKARNVLKVLEAFEKRKPSN